MSDARITLANGQFVDVDELTIGGFTVMRQRAIMGDPADPAGLARVINTVPVGAEYGLVVRPIGSIGISGPVDTELPAAAALADNTANPTAPAVGSFQHVFDGSTWDRAPGDSAQGMDVDVTRSQGHAAHDAAYSGNPHQLGAKSSDAGDSAPANKVSAAGDAVSLLADRDGAQYVRPHPPRIWGECNSVSSDGNIKGAPGAGLSLYVTDIYFQVDTTMQVRIYSGSTFVNVAWVQAQANVHYHYRFATPFKLPANESAYLDAFAVAGTCYYTINGFTAE